MTNEKHIKKSTISNVLIGSLIVFVFLSISSIVFFFFFSSMYSTETNFSPQITIIPFFTPTSTAMVSETNNAEIIATPSITKNDQGFSIGLKVKVHGTGGDGLRVHQDVGQSSATIYLAQEDEIFTISDGPVINGGYEWWKIESTTSPNLSGWVVEDFIQIIVSTT